jgi:hypothetical protein
MPELSDHDFPHEDQTDHRGNQTFPLALHDKVKPRDQQDHAQGTTEDDPPEGLIRVVKLSYGLPESRKVDRADRGPDNET